MIRDIPAQHVIEVALQLVTWQGTGPIVTLFSVMTPLKPVPVIVTMVQVPDGPP